MARRDYILRMIEQLGAALVELRRRILGGARASAVRNDLERTAAQAGLDIDLLRGFDLETLRFFASPTGEVEPARCWLMAEILYLDGLEADLAGRDAEDSLQKARALYDLVRPMGGMLVGMPEAAQRIAEIDRMLAKDPDDDRRRRRHSRRIHLAAALRRPALDATSSSIA